MERAHPPSLAAAAPFATARLALRFLPILLAGAAPALVWAQPAEAPAAEAAEAQPAANPAADPESATAEPENKATDEALLRDFIHYSFIDRPELAKAMGEELVARNIPPADFVRLVERGDGLARFNQAVRYAGSASDTQDLGATLNLAYENGKRAIARNPDQIAANIKLLSGDSRSRDVGRTRLIAAGEYAMPQLFEALLQRTNPTLADQVRQVMIGMRRQAIVPLVTALPQLDPVAQEQVAGILGDIGYPAATPALYRLMGATRSDSVRNASEEAIRRIVGVINTDTPLSVRFANLADEYYAEGRSLTPFPDEAHQLWWTYDPSAGLNFAPIDTPVYHEAMAMKNAEDALRIDPANDRAVSTWIAANFSREIDGAAVGDALLPNPAYAADRRDAMYYAVAAGSAAGQRVLATAIDTSDTPLARQALAAIEQTAGGDALWAGREANRRPLLEALRYPNRRVKYEAALALGAAGPRQSFDGSDQIVRILGGAIRDAGARYALVITSDPEKGRSVSDAFRANGYEPLPTAPSLDAVAQAIADAPGVDVIVTDLPADATVRLIDEAHGSVRLRATPILALLPGPAITPEMSNRFSRDARVRLARQGVSSEQAVAAAEELVETASGGVVSAEEAADYKSRSLVVLRDLAVSGNTALNVADAETPLTAALGKATDETKLRTAEVLSFIPTRAAQGALFDAAMAAEGEERVALLGTVADSAKRAGNLLQPRQVNGLLELATRGQGQEATAAAALMGALSLPNNDLVPLILGNPADQASRQ